MMWSLDTGGGGNRKREDGNRGDWKQGGEHLAICGTNSRVRNVKRMKGKLRIDGKEIRR